MYLNTLDPFTMYGSPREEVCFGYSTNKGADELRYRSDLSVHSFFAT